MRDEDVCWTSGLLDLNVAGFSDFQVDVAVDVAGFYLLLHVAVAGLLDFWLAGFLDFLIAGFLDFLDLLLMLIVWFWVAVLSVPSSGSGQRA